MALSQTDIDALETALATGVLKVRYADGREVTYRSQSELEAALRYVERRVGAGAGRSRSFLAAS